MKLVSENYQGRIGRVSMIKQCDQPVRPGRLKPHSPYAITINDCYDYVTAHMRIDPHLSVIGSSIIFDHRLSLFLVLAPVFLFLSHLSRSDVHSLDITGVYLGHFRAIVSDIAGVLILLFYLGSDARHFLSVGHSQREAPIFPRRHNVNPRIRHRNGGPEGTRDLNYYASYIVPKIVQIKQAIKLKGLVLFV
ncbi:hypothetical protein F5B20DRAFT_518772 [Whalleya microplaca]|nr:hypothetical protein F5B20DRAFT_518772 [Whalleya microplaca]